MLILCYVWVCLPVEDQRHLAGVENPLLSLEPDDKGREYSWKGRRNKTGTEHTGAGFKERACGCGAAL